MGLEMPASGLASHAALWIRELLPPNGFLLRRELVQDSVSHVDHFLIYRAVFGDCGRERGATESSPKLSQCRKEARESGLRPHRQPRRCGWQSIPSRAP